ncbi:hypothetical protein V6617_01325 [Pelagibacterium nitratireducens]|uniref:Uncharacterized protein n=1 Tax=Pelagibacterium nitratireducens TaxID=1046114 RepID=A0ABZ2I3M6_9HYPH
MKIDLELLESSYFTVFNTNHGIRIDKSNGKIHLFEKYGVAWESAEFDRSDISNVETTVGNRVTQTLRGRQGFGEAVGSAIREQMDKTVSEAVTGIQITMKDISLPSFFMSISDTAERQKTATALAHFLKNDMHGSYSAIPPAVYESIQRSNENWTRSDVAPQEVNVEGSGTPWVAIGVLATLVIGTLLLIIVQP